MNLPNKLTMLRIVLVPFFVAALLINFPHHFLVALIIFAVASITDMLDGKIARSRNLVTDFGKFADPLADKILVISALCCFVENGFISSVLVIIVLFREFSVTSIRLIAASKGKVVAANIWGKIKTVVQMIAIIMTLILGYVQELLAMSFFGLNTDFIGSLIVVFTVICKFTLWLSAALALISGIIYIYDNKKFISEK